MIVVFTSACEEFFFQQESRPVIILKADDLGELTPNWVRYFQIIRNEKICSSLGIIPTYIGKQETFDTIISLSKQRNLDSALIFDCWTHGYTHEKTGKITEFQNSADFQFSHLQSAINFFHTRLNLSCSAFGAPFNRSNNYTAEVLTNFPEIEIWFRHIRLEKQKAPQWKDPLHDRIDSTEKRIILTVSYASYFGFIASKVTRNFLSDKSKPYIVIQVHPDQWNEHDFEEFVEMIRFFKSKNGIKFTNPRAFFDLLKKTG